MAEGWVFVILLIAGTVIGFLAGRLSAPRPPRASDAATAAAIPASSPVVVEPDREEKEEEPTAIDDVQSPAPASEEETASPESDDIHDHLLTGAEREELLWLRTRVEQQRSHIGTLESLLELTRSNHDVSGEATESPPETD